MKNTYIVLIPVSDTFNKARKVCEFIQCDIFESSLALRTRLDTLGVDIRLVHIYSLNDFMDECNNQDLDMELFFMSYVQIEKII